MRREFIEFSIRWFTRNESLILQGGDERFKYFKKKFSLSMATTLLPSSIEGFMGLREKHPVYSKLFILFFNEGSPFNLKISGPEKYIWGWFSVPPYCPSYAICSSESIEGNDETLWKVNPRPFQGGEEVSTGLNVATYHLTFETYIIAIIASYLISFVVYYILRKLFPKRYVVIEYEG